MIFADAHRDGRNIRNMALSDTSRSNLGHVECRAFSRPSNEITHFTQLIDIFARCVKERTECIGYLYEMHEEALRCVNDTCTKSEKKRKDAIITPAFIAVYLT